MNWGKGIAIALALFMGFILYLAITLMTRNVDLESDDYYLREIAYQDEIEAVQNAANGPKVEIKINDDMVIIQAPQEAAYKEIQAVFKRPDDDKLDRVFELKGTKILTLEKTLFKPGAYNVEISYLNGDKPCLIKDKIYI
ncbi:MAG: hypothetical protein EP333_04675 [Bacteroidetes bacterium]|nr:MAG: hypothetical protein EP333_04675 [Bacteroidota bacterium]TNE97559.1 MAG: hypothetical protein EP322_06445 [Bacteroidota bacterium]